MSAQMDPGAFEMTASYTYMCIHVCVCIYNTRQYNALGFSSGIDFIPELKVISYRARVGPL